MPRVKIVRHIDAPMGIKRQLLTTVAGLAPEFWASQLRRPVFIIGMARSGTTLLNNLLAQHPSIAALSEANDLWDPTGYPWHTSDRARPPVWIDPVTYSDQWWADNQDRVREIRAVFGCYERLLNSSIFLNKSPLNTYRIGYLLEMFPEAQFVHLVRDGRAVVQSYMRKEWEKISIHPEYYLPYGVHTLDDLPPILATFWQQTLDTVASVDETYALTASGRMMTVTYEALCEQLRPTLTDITVFLSAAPEKYDASIWETPTRSRNDKWRDVFSSETITHIESIMQVGLQTYGYL